MEGGRTLALVGASVQAEGHVDVGTAPQLRGSAQAAWSPSGQGLCEAQRAVGARQRGQLDELPRLQRVGPARRPARRQQSRTVGHQKRASGVQQRKGEGGTCTHSKGGLGDERHNYGGSHGKQERRGGRAAVSGESLQVNHLLRLLSNARQSSGTGTGVMNCSARNIYEVQSCKSCWGLFLRALTVGCKMLKMIASNPSL